MILMIGGETEICRSMINRAANRHGPTNHGPTKSGIPNNPMELPQATIGKMMRWYKGKVSYECRKREVVFIWQARFHDHIIRERRALENIRSYIQNNSLRWEEDMFYPFP